MIQNAKRRIYEILEKALPGDTASKIFDIFIITLIFLNIIAVILGTVKSIEIAYRSFLRSFEVFSVIIFTIEYILRLWSCTSDKKYRSPLLRRLRFATSPMAIIDLLAIVPFYLPMFIPFDLRFVRVLRVFRMFRLFKIGRYSDSMKTLANVLRAKREDLLVTVSAVVVLLVFVSSIMYFVENEAQPEAFASIPAAMWWGVSALTTVGYGDVFPITALGKFLGALIALLGIGMFALPAGILGGGFVEEMQKRKDRKCKTCPHCGKAIDDEG